MNTPRSDWFDDYADEADDIEISENDITATPNDFNVLTLYNFVEAGAVRIPGFQRNFVWDQGRASKLIESLLLGLPVPQIFLYEQNKNSFLVIDGQQRLMSIYYFIKRRFPYVEKRVELRFIFDREGRILEKILYDDSYFHDFTLKLSERLPDRRNKFHGLNYATLGDHKLQFELRPIRNVVVKQNAPRDDDSSMYEVFNRLNTGGINLTPQEIRTSMYHSEFYDMLYRINSEPAWRRLLQSREPDLHMKDIEILLRGLAMLIDGDAYAPSMVRFLNGFSKRREKNSESDNKYIASLFCSFLAACEHLPDIAFINKGNRRFNIALYEAVFTAVCRRAFAEKRMCSGTISTEDVATLENDKEFQAASLQGTTRTSNVKARLARADALVSAR